MSISIRRGHTVCETTDDLKALISAARSIDGPGFLAPSRNGELLRWCFAKGLRSGRLSMLGNLLTELGRAAIHESAHAQRR
jgi:hypothetical protein